MINKRGQGLSTNAIVLIILAVVVLVILILGFTMGWSKLAPWLGGNNVKAIVTQCDVACSTGSTYDFCTVSRTLKADGLFDQSNPSVAVDEYTESCDTFSKDSFYIAQGFGIDTCPTITCVPTVPTP